MAWSWKHPLKSWKKLEDNKRFIIGIVSVMSVMLGLSFIRILETSIRAGYLVDWTGFGSGDAITIDIQQDQDGNITEIIASEPSKTLWDWLGLLGVPVTLAGLGFLFQQKQQQREAEEAAEEILQTYLDRVSAALVDNNILAIAQKNTTISSISEKDIKPTREENELLNAAIDVVRARTLSILRRFEKDSNRKSSIIRFLIEAEVLSKGKLPLKGADLSDANLSGADLISADLSGANLSGADLISADLSGANLSGANLKVANLGATNLSSANLSGANLSSANLSSANLSSANLSIDPDLTNALLDAYRTGAGLKGANFIDVDGASLGATNLIGANLSGAALISAVLSTSVLIITTLSGANLSGANLSGADLSGADLRFTTWSSTTQVPNADEFANAKNVPLDLEKQLGTE